MIRILLFSLLVSFASFSQTKHNILERFDTSNLETSILVQENPLVSIQKYQDVPNSVYDFYQAYKTIQQHDFLQRLPSLEALKQQTIQAKKQQVVPIAILYSKYETIKKTAFLNNQVTNDSEGFLIRSNPQDAIFDKHELFLSSVLATKHKGLEVLFELKSANIYNTTDKTIKYIEMDFDNGNGFSKIKQDTPITIPFTTVGTKNIQTKIVFLDGTVKINTSSLLITYSNSDLKSLFGRNPATFTASITPDLSVYGETTSYPAQGEYEIFLSTEPNAVLDKPLIIIDGFDPQDSRPITGYVDSSTGDFVVGIYEMLNFTNAAGNTDNLADLIRAEGFDVIILNFPEYTRQADNELIDGGSDFIERNAMLLVELINQINAQKVGNQQNVIIGPSMGGLVSRYALSYMESVSMNHDTRLWISFDAPHQGANVPIGFQHQFNYLAYGLDDFWFIGNQNVESLQPLIDGFMKSAAARQMLVDHFEAHITDSDGVSFNSNLTLPIAHPFKSIFYNRLLSLTASGYPENLRKANMINGSGFGNAFPDIDGNDVLPGREVVNTTIDVESGVDATLQVSYTPYANNQIEVSDVYIDFAWWIPAFDVHSTADSMAQVYSHGVDASPGGLYNLGLVGDTIGTNGLAGEFLAALQTDYFNFIPTVSAMDISFPNNEINWFMLPNNNNPFDSWYMPTENEPHITLTQENVDYAWNEIVLQDPLFTQENVLNNTVSIKNPVINNELLIRFNQEYSYFNLKIFDLTGKQIFDYSDRNSNVSITIPVNINTGIYFAIVTLDGNKEKVKLIFTD